MPQATAADRHAARVIARGAQEARLPLRVVHPVELLAEAYE